MYFHTLLPSLVKKYYLHFTDEKMEVHGHDNGLLALNPMLFPLHGAVLRCGLWNHQGTWFKNADSGSEGGGGVWKSAF